MNGIFHESGTRNKILLSRVKTTLGEWPHVSICFLLSPVFYICFTISLLFLYRSITRCLHWEWFWARKWRRLSRYLYITLSLMMTGQSWQGKHRSSFQKWFHPR